MTRWSLDTEFNEDGKTIELISIALVSEDGREFYAVSSEFNPESCNDWVKENVLPLLPGERMSRAEIAEKIKTLLLEDGAKPEIWAYFADYDWVAFCQLFGPMINLPTGFPMWCRDLKQRMTDFGVEKNELPKQTGAVHSALEDARWVINALMYLDKQSLDITI
jgi:hypothetical protein